MIISMKPLSLAEVHEYVHDSEEKKPIHDYLKKYAKLSAEQSRKLIEALRALNNVKIKEDYLIKIADFLPRDAEEIHKIFHDVSLDEGEVNAILDIVKEY